MLTSRETWESFGVIVSTEQVAYHSTADLSRNPLCRLEVTWQILSFCSLLDDFIGNLSHILWCSQNYLRRSISSWDANRGFAVSSCDCHTVLIGFWIYLNFVFLLSSYILMLLFLLYCFLFSTSQEVVVFGQMAVLCNATLAIDWVDLLDGVQFSVNVDWLFCVGASSLTALLITCTVTLILNVYVYELFRTRGWGVLVECETCTDWVKVIHWLYNCCHFRSGDIVIIIEISSSFVSRF